MLGGPFLLVALIMGLVISILQAATQIQEMALTFIPKVGSIGLTLYFLAGWLLRTWLTYMTKLVESLGNLGVVP
jgi:flagellar biosynthetic protein FliQ